MYYLEEIIIFCGYTQGSFILTKRQNRTVCRKIGRAANYRIKQNELDSDKYGTFSLISI